MENKILSKIEKEFEPEIASKEIEIEDLTFLGLSESTLKGEVYLRTKYGDEFLDLEKNSIEVDVSKKTISKVEFDELEETNKLSLIIDKLTNSEFNNNFNYVFIKCTKEE